MTTAEAIAFVGLIILALGISGIALWQKQVWLFLGAGLAWIGLGGYLLASYARGEPLWAIAWLGIGFGLLFFMAPLWLREKPEPSAKLSEDELFVKELEDDYGPLAKARAKAQRKRSKRRERAELARMRKGR